MTALTNGCFDLCHLGHLDFLRRAAALGGGLVTVALNTDASVRRLKGADRPFVPCADRKALLEMLPWVDRVDAFDGEDDLRALIDRLRPDVLVKGADYAGRPIAGADLLAGWGGQVVLLPLMEGRSTSALVATIRGAAAEICRETHREILAHHEAMKARLLASLAHLDGQVVAFSRRAVDAEATVERLRARVKELEAAVANLRANLDAAAGWRPRFLAAEAEIRELKGKLADPKPVPGSVGATLRPSHVPHVTTG